MRRTALFFLLVFSRVIFGCDAPHGFPLIETRYVPDCGFNRAVLAVSDGGAFAAWHFTHVGFGTVTGTNYGAPLDEQGRARVNEEIPYAFLGSPSVASDGRDFLLVINDSTATRAMVVDRDGKAGALQLVASSHTGGQAGVVWTGSEYLVVNLDLAAAHVSRDGTVTNVNQLTTGATLAALTNGLVIWKRGATFEAAPIGGAAVSLPAIPSTASVNVASSGNGFLAVFIDTNGRVAALRLDISGNPIANPIEIASESLVSTLIDPPQVAYEGGSFLVLWDNAGSIVRAAHVPATNGAASAPFVVANGFIWAATPSRDGTLVAYGTGCGSIATRVITRGANNGTTESIVSMHASAQTSPRIASTALGRQVLWFEGNSLYTRFIGGSGSAGAVMRLSNNVTFHAAIVAISGGTAIVFDDDRSLRLARLDAAGNLTGVGTLPSTSITFSISLAAVGDELLVVTSGEDELFKTEVDAVRVSDSLQRVVLSHAGEDGFNAIAGGDGAHWYAAWRNGSSHLAAIEMPRGDLRQQTRFDTTLPTSVSGTLGGIAGGGDPAVIWTNGNVHATYFHSGLDILLAAAVNAFGVRVIDGDAYWIETSPTTRILSAPVTRTPASAAVEKACLAKSLIGIDYEIRNGAVSAIVYPDGSQLRVEERGVTRRRASR